MVGLTRAALAFGIVIVCSNGSLAEEADVLDASAAEKATKAAPAGTESAATEPTEKEPSGTESSGKGPGEAEPSGTDSAVKEPAKSEPAGTESAATEPTKTKPPETDSAAKEPVKAEPSGTDTAATEPAKSEPAVTETSPTAPTDQETQAVAAEPVIDDPVVAAVVKALGDSPRGSDDREKAESIALAKFYKTADRKPVWVDAQKIRTVATTVTDEIKRANDYGLDPSAFRLPSLSESERNTEDLARTELALSRAALHYARHAKGGRIKPGQVGQQLHDAPVLPDPFEILEALASSLDKAAYLRGLHPKHPQFEMLRKKYVAMRDSREKRNETRLPAGPVLRRGVAHDQVILLRKRLSIAAKEEEGSKEDDNETEASPRKFDETVETAVKAFQREAGLKVDGVVGAGTRKALNGNTSERRLYQLLINMERWRWLTEDLDGDAGIYVWANIPEFRVKIIKNGKKVFNERVIVGKTDKQTPVFSDKMEWIEIHPTWYVPNSIKVGDILPSLKRRTSKVVERYHLRINCGRHGSDPTQIDWSKVNIRNCSVTQPPGAKSVLGDFKFKFPNKHAVYMHDTLSRSLFNRTTRTFSHGCLRIRNPRRMAEILLDHDKVMSSTRLGKILAGPRRLHTAKLKRHVPVHITYFTAFFDDDGKFTTRADYYGNDRRLARVLVGKGNLFPVARAAPQRKRVRKRRTTQRDRDAWHDNTSMQN